MSEFQLRKTVLDLLMRIEQSGGYSHLLIDQAIKKHNIPSRDEGLLTEIVYGTMQSKLTLDFYIADFANTKKKVKPWVQMLLRMSVYQMVYLDKIPDHAIVHEAVEIAKERGHKGIASFVNGVLRNMQRKGVRDTSGITPVSRQIAIETSHPVWLVKRWIAMYGTDITRSMCQANGTRKPMSIRIQPLKITRKEAMQELREAGYEARESALSEQGIVIEKGNIVKSNLLQEGMAAIQDQSSMLAAAMLDPHPGMTVLDACSAPGGKTTHIAELMQDHGVVYAHDLHAKKVKLVNKKASELDLSIIQARQGDARKLQGVYNEAVFDRILVDAPCSGLGVVRTKPDIKYHKHEGDIQQLAAIQLDILQHVAPLLKKGGRLLYSTCTVDREENNGVVAEFLENNPGFEFDNTFFDLLPDAVKQPPGRTSLGLQLFPQTLETDGFFLARFIRKS